MGAGHWASPAELVGVPMPMINAVIDIYTIIHETDWRLKSNTMKNFCLDNMKKEQLLDYVKTGKKI